MKKLDGQTLFLAGAVAASVIGLAVLVLRPAPTPADASTLLVGRRPVAAQANPLDAARSFRYLEQICELGPRFSGSPGMDAQRELLRKHFSDLGGQVTEQPFRVRHPLTGQPVAMSNLVVEWHPERQERILLCAHYDTRPFPDRDPDPQLRQGVFVGANDGGSGVAVLMELAHLMPQFAGEIGLDFVLFDGEELVYDEDRDPYFLGSRYFATAYAQQPPAHRYRAAVLFDMVGDRDLQIYRERNSMSWRDSRPIVDGIWRTAEQLGVKEFKPRLGYEIRDDHIMLHDIGKIPACDLIDFDYGGPAGRRGSYWHTTADTPDKCSGESLAKVGWVVWVWLGSLGG